MKRIKTKGTVTPEGILTVQVTPEIPPGSHSVVVLIDERASEKRNIGILDFPVDKYGSWPSDLSLRREDIYGDDQR